MAKVISWTPQEFKEQLGTRLKSCKENREPWDRQWSSNGNIMYSDTSNRSGTNQFNISFENKFELGSGEVDEGDSDIGTNFTYKFVRHRLGQLSANPPSTITKPTSSDLNDRKRADAADRVIRHGYNEKEIQKHFDRLLQKTLVRSIGWIKIVWNPDKGNVSKYDKSTQEIEMEGDIDIYSPSTYDIYVDPLAKVYDDARYVFERHYLALDEAKFRFPGKEQLLLPSKNEDRNRYDDTPNKEETVIIYEYYEKGMPINGMAGRHAFCNEAGDLLQEPTKNHHYDQRLPYINVTDIDLEDSVYGKSTIELVARHQDLINRFDSASIDAMEAHGVIRMAVSEASEINDDEISNTNFDIVKYSGAIAPHFINPGALPPDLARLREQMKVDIQDLMGINDSMMGVQKREQSGFSQQTSIESGNIPNRPLFNKYTKAVKDFWEMYLGLAIEHWTIGRTIKVLGKEKILEVRDIKGADIADGYDVIVEYGASLPLDPNMRREQIMLMIEPLKEAGIPMVRILKMLKLNELDAIYDELEQGEDRQREIFEKMINMAERDDAQYIAPEELENHEFYLIFARKYRNSMEYKILPEEVQMLVEQHIKERMEMAANVQATGSATPPPPPMGPEGMPPMPPPQMPVV